MCIYKWPGVELKKYPDIHFVGECEYRAVSLKRMCIDVSAQKYMRHSKLEAGREQIPPIE